MLFSYPIATTSENWVHESVTALILAIHHQVEGNAAYHWPDSIPEMHRQKLAPRIGLQERLETYQDKLEKLSKVNRTRVRNCLLDQNNIPQLLDGTADCEVVADLPAKIREAIKDLFSFAFQLLKDFSIRDRHYAAIYASAKNHVCPFCGAEYFDAPGAPREDLDHYLAKSIYPFAGANLANLVPMGSKCNQKYKSATNIIRDEDGNRRLAFYPYGAPGLVISLSSSVPFSGVDGRLPAWNIEFTPDTSEAHTWDFVFRIKERYQRDILNPSFFDWLGSFQTWFKKEFKGVVINDEVIANAITKYIEILQEMELTGPESFRTPVFLMLRHHWISENQRLRELMRDLTAVGV